MDSWETSLYYSSKRSYFDKEAQRIAEIGRIIFRENGLIPPNFNHIFSSCYLSDCWNDEAKKSIYRRLVEIDSKLGTKASTLLFACLKKTTRSDLIKVLVKAMIYSMRYF